MNKTYAIKDEVWEPLIGFPDTNPGWMRRLTIRYHTPAVKGPLELFFSDPGDWVRFAETVRNAPPWPTNEGAT